MPLTSSAIRSLNKDRKRARHNQPLRNRVRTVIQKAKESRKPDDISLVYSTIDRAAKTNIIHPNKAARLKSRLQLFLHTHSKTQG